ncbi:MAG: ABC transporter substrate binding protein [Chloroflexi bacterium]|nr:ABC transporter substrate binding protein [Chloroflexota bacterium]
MCRKLIISLLLLTFALLNGAAASANGGPTVAILRFGGLSDALTITEGTVLDVLQSYGFISADERAALNDRADLHGENLNIIWDDAGTELIRANLMIEKALDQGADVLLTLTTPVTRAAVNLTLDMDRPPAIIFASVYSPADAGVAQSQCVKPAHVTGVFLDPPYQRIMELITLLDPNISIIGTVFSAREISGSTGADSIATHGQGAGLQVLKGFVSAFRDMHYAIEGLIGRGAQALVLPVDSVTARSMSIASDLSMTHGIPLIYGNAEAVFEGATLGMGTYRHVDQGLNVGRILTGYLAGDLDIATTGISAISGHTVALNLDVAAAQGVEISNELLALADIVIEDNQAITSTLVQARLAQRPIDLPDIAFEHDAAYLQSLHCTEEMIAEQKAALDAAG